MPQRRFPRLWRFESIPGGFRVIDANSLALARLPKRMPVPEVARQLVCSKCGARNTETFNPIWARPDERVGASADTEAPMTRVEWD